MALAGNWTRNRRQKECERTQGQAKPSVALCELSPRRLEKADGIMIIDAHAHPNCSVKNERPHLAWLQQACATGHISPEVFEKIVWKNIDGILNLGLDKPSSPSVSS